jgi:hypothetical protein
MVVRDSRMTYSTSNVSSLPVNRLSQYSYESISERHPIYLPIYCVLSTVLECTRFDFVRLLLLLFLAGMTFDACDA